MQLLLCVLKNLFQNGDRWVHPSKRILQLLLFLSKLLITLFMNKINLFSLTAVDAASCKYFIDILRLAIFRILVSWYGPRCSRCWPRHITTMHYFRGHNGIYFCLILFNKLKDKTFQILILECFNDIRQANYLRFFEIFDMF